MGMTMVKKGQTRLFQSTKHVSHITSQRKSSASGHIYHNITQYTKVCIRLYTCVYILIDSTAKK